MTIRHLAIGNVKIGNDLPLVLIAGPCQIESRDHALMMAEKLIKLTNKLSIPFIYKSSYDKANRTSISGKRGVGLVAAMPILDEIRNELGCPVLTDVHTEEQVPEVAAVVDVLQTPAFLCRQTDFITACAKSGKPVNIKKGQFLAPGDMKNVIDKARNAARANGGT